MTEPEDWKARALAAEDQLKTDRAFAQALEAELVRDGFLAEPGAIWQSVRNLIDEVARQRGRVRELEAALRQAEREIPRGSARTLAEPMDVEG